MKPNFQPLLCDTNKTYLSIKPQNEGGHRPPEKMAAGA